MNRTLLISLAAVLVSTLHGAELKVAVLDLDRVIGGYFKTDEARKEIASREASLDKELRGLRLEGEKMEKEAESLRALALDNGLSTSAREQNKKSFEAKVEEIRHQALKLDDFRNDGLRQLRERSQRLQYRIVEDVNKATAALGQKEGYHLILNANKANPAASPVLFARNLDDVTEKVLSNLNASKSGSNDTGTGKPEAR